ncbi:unnamed protein product [Lymnaea stagnalis]|uniref:Uncharacterized protein n=1 Tax=Lymnaea stagnalis TaxID=6523 RepID=A0AAV2GZU9_LYMST
MFNFSKNRSPHKNFRKIFSPAGRRKEKVDYDEEEELIQKEEDLKDVQIDIFTSIDEDYKHCQKKHKDFMSKKELTLSDLPEHMQNEDVFDLIKTTADLTVMVTFSDDSDTLKKMGTGWIGHILQYTKKDKMKCTCKKCRKSPNYDWGKITVYTSTDVVPNNSNGKQVVCSIFIDDDEDNVLHLQGCEVEAKFHKCRIKFKTCNAELLKKLNKLRQKVTELTYKINTKYKDLNDGSLISDDDERLVIIISYIHGMNRRVSLGSWSHRSAKIDKKNNIEITKYIYTAPTCLGSTGAYVYILGRAHCGWLYQHYHVGVNALNQGFCGYGIDA